MKNRVILDRGVKSGVIAERSFRPRLPRLHITFEHEINVGRNFQIVRLAFHQLDRFLAQKPGEENFIQPIRQRRGGGKSISGIATDRDRDRHPFVAFVVTLAVTRSDFVHLPMHAGRAVVVNLHAIHPEVAFAGFRIARMHIRQRDEASAILRPAFQDRKIEKREFVLIGAAPSRSGAPLPGTAPFHMLRPRVQQVHALFEQRPSFAQIRRRFRFQDELKFPARDRRYSPPASASAIRFSDPMVLIATGNFETWPSINGCSKSSALPPPGDFISRSAHSAMTRSVSTGMRDPLQFAGLVPARREIEKKTRKPFRCLTVLYSAFRRVASQPRESSSVKVRAITLENSPAFQRWASRDVPRQVPPRTKEWKSGERTRPRCGFRRLAETFLLEEFATARRLASTRGAALPTFQPVVPSMG